MIKIANYVQACDPTTAINPGQDICKYYPFENQTKTWKYEPCSLLERATLDVNDDVKTRYALH